MNLRQTLLKLYKNEGETPLQCLDRFRIANPDYKEAVLSYVGRLDPMAEGLLLVVVDKENKKREDYLHLDKTYEVEILFGIKTDTGDVLGKVINAPASANGVIPSSEEMKEKLHSLVGEITLPYPSYSSKPVNGKSLFEWTREGRLNEIEIPTKTSIIHSIEQKKDFELSKEELLRSVIARINKIKGDFRQEEIINTWEKSLASMETEKFNIISIEVNCTSGTYMRILAEKIGEMAGIPAIAWKIKRVKVGNYTL